MNKILEMMDSIQTDIQLCGEPTHDAGSIWPKRWEALRSYVQSADKYVSDVHDVEEFYNEPD